MALVFDNATDGGDFTGGGNKSFSHTVSASANRILFLAFRVVGANQLSAVKCDGGGISLTRLAEQSEDGDSAFVSLWFALNPGSGSNNITFTVGGTNDAQVGAVSYVNAAQVTPEVFSVNQSGGLTTSITGTLTTSTSGDWTVMAAGNNVGGWSAGGGTAMRYGGSTSAHALFDSNAPIIPAGVANLVANGNNGHYGLVMAAFAGTTVTTTQAIPVTATAGVAFARSNIHVMAFAVSALASSAIAKLKMAGVALSVIATTSVSLVMGPVVRIWNKVANPAIAGWHKVGKGSS